MTVTLKHYDDELRLPCDTTTPRRKATFRSTTFIRVLKYLILCCLALILSTPWSYFHSRSLIKVPFQTTHTDPASEWQDDVWPLRPQTPWDISTDFRYPRKLAYEVSEGTWLRLDVHPKSGDIVFDMVGDLYCLSANDVAKESLTGGATRARPILLGVPFDSDPHFSPGGDRIVFRSDAELGIENIWVMEWNGCESMDVRSQSKVNGELSEALKLKETEDEMLATGIKETAERRHRRLLREGRHGAQRVTNETYRWVSDARFHPSGSKVIATKWYTSARSLGAGEAWEYAVPSLKDLQSGTHTKQIEAGSGNRVLGRSLPLGWTAEDYGDQQIGPEQIIWNGDDRIIYSKNVRDASEFTYSKDVHSGIYAIFQRNLTSKTTETLVDAYPGGASRPEISRDSRTLAFVRRVRDKEALVLKDLQTGTIHNIWHGLTYDLSAISAPMGTYPSFAFTPSDDAIIIWAAGQIYSVPLSTNERGEKIGSSKAPYPIRFAASIEKYLAETLRGGVNVAELESQDTQRVRAMRGLRADGTGQKVTFQAAGVTYLQKVGERSVTTVPVLHGSAPYYSPSFVHGDDDLILHARWSDTNFTSFELANIRSGIAHELVGLPIGRYFSPILCECPGRQRQIAFIKSGGTYLTGDILATAGPGLYIVDITLPSQDSAKSEQVKIRNLRHVNSEIDPNDRVNMRFLDKNEKLLVQQSNRAFIIDFQAGPNQFADYPHRTVATGMMSSEIVISLKPAEGSYAADGVAFVDFFHVYFAHGDALKEDEPVWTKVGNATKGLARLSLDGGHDVTWSRDGKKVFWFLGPFLHSLEISKLANCSSEIKTDRTNYGITCVKDLLQYQEIHIAHSTDIARLKRDANAARHEFKSWLSVEPENVSKLTPLLTNDTLVIYNATLLTMATGDLRGDLIRGGILVSQGGVITGAGTLENTFVPERATAINAQEAFVVPGFIDVHAHWEGFADLYPAKSWEMETFLAYGVTTLHNPSAATVEGFDERSRIERGQLIGPRIFTVGDIIYGAGAPGIHQDIVDQEEAYSALLRLKAEGGPASISYKNYNIPSRASRQRLLIAGKNLSMLCVPEGGMNLDWDLTYIIDGMTTVEHALPVPTLYEDVMTLYALSGTGSTPTHLVNYGGVMGEQLIWATEDIPNDPKLRTFTRHDILERLSESTSRPATSYALFNTSVSIAKMVKNGLRVHIGAHGEPPLGLNYHAEMAFTQSGGLNNYEVLRAATSSAAETLGMFQSLGSLSPGKLADFLIYMPGVDLLEGDIANTRKLRFVARGSRIWDASTMAEVWPVKGRKQAVAPLNPE